LKTGSGSLRKGFCPPQPLQPLPTASLQPPANLPLRGEPSPVESFNKFFYYIGVYIGGCCVPIHSGRDENDSETHQIFLHLFLLISTSLLPSSSPGLSRGEKKVTYLPASEQGCVRRRFLIMSSQPVRQMTVTASAVG
jgi:hypothetical protein